jgi:succinate dehydrogenase / fumarate reductase cytochrome b subunit
MNTLLTLYTSSIGKKFMMGATGVLLSLFLVVHVAGNLLLFVGKDAFDWYASTLPNLPLIPVIEALLFALFLFHIFMGTMLWFRNRQARPQKYEVVRQGENSKLTSRIMFLTGSVVFIFLVIHLRNFWFPSKFGGGEHGSMYELVKESFINPVYAVFYIAAMFLLAFHLHHGFQSAFQTFGIKGKRYEPLIKAIAAIFWLLIPLVFALMPVYFLMNA